MARWRFRPQALTLLAVIVAPMVILLCAFNAEKQNNFCHSIAGQDKNFQAISYYCNFIEEQVSGKEGEVPWEEFTLEQVQVIIRHGDRTGIHSMPNYIEPLLSCSFSNYPHLFPHTPGLGKFVETMDQSMKDLLYLPSSLQNFSLYPFQDLCRTGQLTPTGIAQQVKNGAFLQSRYKESDLFKSLLVTQSPHKQAQLVTTKLERTFQSGIAFLYGLLPNFQLSQIEVLVALNQSMCSLYSQRSRFSCGCKEVENYHQFTSQTYGLTFAPENVEKKAEPYTQIALAFDITKEQMPTTQSLLDTGMVHMCHKLPLPGSLRKCMGISSLRHVVNEANDHGRYNSERGRFPSIAKFRMLPLIDQIYTNMHAMATGREAQKIVVYSGHDNTLDPLLVALNISQGVWPKYASRLVIELYSYQEASLATKFYFFRVLYNGQDRTIDTINCKDSLKHGLCPLETLDIFLDVSNSFCDSTE